MKKISLMLAAVLMTGATATAQTASQDKKEKASVAKKMSKFWRQVKDEVTYTADGLFSKEGNYKVLVDGQYYMPVYDVNLYKGSDGKAMRNECGTLLLTKYPKAEIVACALPQTEWATKPIEKDGKVTGYEQTMYCYVLAKDGDDGYINQRYLFVRTKEVGHDYVADSTRWALLQGTDVMTNDVYNKVKNYKKKK